MQRGLAGRRVALLGIGDAATTVEAELRQAGAEVHRLSSDAPPEDWHGAKYAALVLTSAESAQARSDSSAAQLVREFLVSDKPLAAFGGGVGVILAAGGLQGRTVAADDALRSGVEQAGAQCVSEPIHTDESLITAREDVETRTFATRLVREFANRLEDRAVDEMSELSFPASDPPAVSPTSVGHAAPDKKA